MGGELTLVTRCVTSYENLLDHDELGNDPDRLELSRIEPTLQARIATDADTIEALSAGHGALVQGLGQAGSRGTK
jgi:hypothetical protein